MVSGVGGRRDERKLLMGGVNGGLVGGDDERGKRKNRLGSAFGSFECDFMFDSSTYVTYESMKIDSC
jgi:hypothetical protein